jgi:hypothetical protein
VPALPLFSSGLSQASCAWLSQMLPCLQGIPPQICKKTLQRFHIKSMLAERHWTTALRAAALRRKGKGDDVTEDDMGSVVHAHNSKSSPKKKTLCQL